MDLDYQKFLGDMPTNSTLTELFNQNKVRICSLEVSCNKPIPFEILEKIKVKFISVIWLGTHDTKPDQIGSLVLAKDLISKGYTVVLHITARNNTKKSLTKALDYAKSIGIKNLFCIRGGSEECKLEASQYDFPYTPHMLKYIKAAYGDYFDICVAGFPYKHPESKTMEEDLKYLKQRCDAGAKYIITQACFSYDTYKQFLNTIRKNKINQQVIPGVYVIQSVVDFCLLKKLCKIPQDDPVVTFIKDKKGKDAEIAAFGLKLSTEIVLKLLHDTDFMPPHIFSMNEFAMIDGFLKNLREK